jgi:hypothetical protein
MMTVLSRGLIVVGVLTAGIAVGRFALPPGGLATRPAGAPPAEASGRPAPHCWEATVYLPLTDNQGRRFSEAAWEAALADLVVPFGGATLGQPQEGCWLRASGRICREPVRPVVVSFALERLGEFRDAVHAAGQRLGQEAMYVRFEEPRVELIPVGGARPAEGRSASPTRERGQGASWNRWRDVRADRGAGRSRESLNTPKRSATSSRRRRARLPIRSARTRCP